MELSVEQVKQNRLVKEYTKLVTDPKNLIGLSGHQPTLTKIREAYQSQEITDDDLKLVLTKLAQDLKGNEEPFANHKAAYEFMFSGVKKPELNPTILSAAEQAIAIQSIMPSKKKTSSPRKKAVKPADKIDVSALPEHLRYLI